MSDHVVAWAWRVAWVLAPLFVHPAVRHHSPAVRSTVEIVAWAGWAVVLLGMLVVHPVGLVLLRSATACGAAAGVASFQLSAGGVSTAAYMTAVAVASLLPRTGELFVNGPAYPNERRYVLRPPGPLLVGPIEAAAFVAPGVPVAGGLLLASRQWVLGGAALVGGIAAAVVLGRALYALTRRWVVFVPAGLVLHDPTVLDEPVLVRRSQIAALGPALVGTTAVDLRRGAPGLAVELATTGLIHLPPHGEVDRVLIAPTRPGALLADAAARSFPVRTS